MIDRIARVKQLFETSIRVKQQATEPLAPVMTANAGKQLSSLSMSGKNVAAVLRPCELRAFVERVKREKGSFENLLTISPTCPGVFPLDRVLEEDFDGLAASYLDAVSEG